MIKILDKRESNNQDIDFTIFKSIVKPKYKLFKSVLQNQMVIKDCKTFKAKTQALFDKVEQTDFGGFLPSYIPALMKVDKDKFAVSICTVDGQIFNFGDTRHHATQQAISSVLSYLIALDQHGQETISSYIGTEPSGQAFNSLELLNGKPHNPLINSGNLTCCSLMYKDETIDRKYELYSKVIKRLIGGHRVHFNNEVYLSEFANADRNCCLLYMLKEKGIIPKDADIKKILQFYTQT
jgi:glutaminase